MISRDNKDTDGARPSATALLDNLLDTKNDEKSHKNNEDLTIVNLLNQGFLKIFEAQYEEAIKCFR